MTDAIPDWTTAQTFHPQLTITSGAPDSVVAVLRQEFERAGYTTLDTTPAQTRLRYHDWLAIVSGKWERTEVLLSAGPDSVLVAVTKGAVNRSGRKKGQQALNAAMALLSAQGIDVTVGPWHKAP